MCSKFHNVSGAKQEYSQALLEDDELRNNSLNNADLPASNHRRRHRWWTLFSAIPVFLVACVVLTPSIRRAFLHNDDAQATASDAVFQDDYILRETWDYLATPQLREYEWSLEETEFNPDGVYRQMLLINNQFPGPLIEVNEDDTISVTVHNRMSNATSIHWHGIYQNGSNFMDGTVGITQCPIAPGTSFTYRFTVSSQSGTYWYHAHQATQAADGLFGPIIVHSRQERALQQLEYSSDRIIMLSDHYHHLTSSLAQKYLAPDMENTEPVPDGALFNGRAVRNCDDLPKKRCDNSTLSYPRIHVHPDQKHRIRIINTGSFAQFQFQVDEHELAVTEADGTDLIPTYHRRLNIAPAQRYSIILTANQTHRDEFRIRARMVSSCFAGINDLAVNDVEAIVAYSDAQATSALPESRDWTEQLDSECKDMNMTELVPVNAVPAPAEEDAFFYMRTNFRIGDYRLSRGYFNESTWRSNVSSPTLLDFLDSNSSFLGSSQTSNNDNVTVSTGSNHLTIHSPGIKTIDLLIHNTDDGAHPMHLHGYKFFTLAQGHGYPPRTSVLEGVSRETVQPLYDSLDLTNPLRRDTATVPAYGWLLIRFVADNPGAWAFHCHINWHAEAGLMMQFLTRTDALKNMIVPEATRALCAVDAAELEKGTTPKDEDYRQEALDGSERNGTGCEGESARLCSYDDD